MSKTLNMIRRGMNLLTKDTKGFDRLAKQLEVVSATDNGQVKFQWTVGEDQLNAFQTLHGGYTSFIVDFTTTAALMTVGNHRPGVSVDLSISYLKSAKAGEVVTLETDVKKVGSNLAFLEATLLNSKGDIIALGKHTKFVGEGVPQRKTV